MLSCRKATELIEKGKVVKLSLVEKMQLRLHTSVCSGCSAYQKQSKIIDSWLYDHFTHTRAADSNDVNNEELKKRIISRL